MMHDEHGSSDCGCGCSCGHEHPHQADTQQTPVEVTESQRDFLHQLHHRHYLPVARFTITDSRQEDFVSTALAPVFLSSASDDMKTVKETGLILKNLEDLGLITLDYDIPLNKYDYKDYKESAVYAYFCETVAEGASRPNFLGNTPVLELGSIALTEAGEQIAAAGCGHNHEHQTHE